ILPAGRKLAVLAGDAQAPLPPPDDDAGNRQRGHDEAHDENEDAKRHAPDVAEMQHDQPALDQVAAGEPWMLEGELAAVQRAEIDHRAAVTVVDVERAAHAVRIDRPPLAEPEAGLLPDDESVPSGARPHQLAAAFERPIPRQQLRSRRALMGG